MAKKKENGTVEEVSLDDLILGSINKLDELKTNTEKENGQPVVSNGLSNGTDTNGLSNETGTNVEVGNGETFTNENQTGSGVPPVENVGSENGSVEAPKNGTGEGDGTKDDENSVKNETITSLEGTSKIVPEKPVDDGRLKSTKRISQALKKETVKIVDGIEYEGVSQEVDLSKLGFKNQKFTLLDDNNILAVVSKGGEKPVAFFEKRQDGKIGLSISQTFLDELKKSNPTLVLPEGKVESGFASFDIEKLKLSSNLSLQDIEIKGANTDFAIMFSALGCQISDGKTVGKVANTDKKPFDVALSDEFVKLALNNENGCSMDREEPAYSAVLISMLNLEREKHNKLGKDNATTPLTTSLNGVKLHSVPVKDKDGNITYLNIREENGEKSIYLHVSKEDNKRSKTVPRFWKISEIGLQSNFNTNNPVESLYLGLASTDNNVTAVNIELGFENNVVALTKLQQVLTAEFNKTSQNQRAKGAKRKVQTIKADDVEKKFDVTPISAEANAHVLSYNGVAVLSRNESLENSEVSAPPVPPVETNDLPENEMTNNLVNNPPSDDDDVPVDDDSLDDDDSDNNSASDDKNSSGLEGFSDEEITKLIQDLQAQKGEKLKEAGEIEKQAGEKKKELIPPKKDVKIEEPESFWKKMGSVFTDKEKHPVTSQLLAPTMMAGLAALTVLLSIVAPIFAIVASVLTVGTAVVMVKPWDIFAEQEKLSKERSEEKKKARKIKQKEKLNDLLVKKEKLSETPKDVKAFEERAQQIAKLDEQIKKETDPKKKKKLEKQLDKLNKEQEKQEKKWGMTYEERKSLLEKDTKSGQIEVYANALNNTDDKIKDLDEQIKKETDPKKKKELEKQRKELISTQKSLQKTLDKLEKGQEKTTGEIEKHTTKLDNLTKKTTEYLQGKLDEKNQKKLALSEANKKLESAKLAAAKLKTEISRLEVPIKEIEELENQIKNEKDPKKKEELEKKLKEKKDSLKIDEIQKQIQEKQEALIKEEKTIAECNSQKDILISSSQELSEEIKEYEEKLKEGEEKKKKLEDKKGKVVKQNEFLGQTQKEIEELEEQIKKVSSSEEREKLQEILKKKRDELKKGKSDLAKLEKDIIKAENEIQKDIEEERKEQEKLHKSITKEEKEIEELEEELELTDLQKEQMKIDKKIGKKQKKLIKELKKDSSDELIEEVVLGANSDQSGKYSPFEIEEQISKLHKNEHDEVNAGITKEVETLTIEADALKIEAEEIDSQIDVLLEEQEKRKNTTKVKGKDTGGMTK